ncbi:MAG: acetoacetate decarboxylase family protein [Planctomycetia bacterium]
MSNENKATTEAFAAQMAKATIWKNARILMVNANVSATAAAALLPPGLTLAPSPQASLFIADYPLPGAYGDPYLEAAILVHASDAKGKFCFCPWMVVTTDTALILGREFLGFPKKLGAITLTEEAGKVIGTASRKGTEVMRIEAVLGAQESPGSTPTASAHK